MLSVTSTLAAAIDGLTRWIEPSVVVDWAGDGAAGSFDDLSASVTSLVVDRAITSDLPAEANILEGDAAGQATVALGPDLNGVSPAQMLSPYKAHLAGARRVGAPITVKVRFKGSAGWESVPALVGKVRTAATSADGSATLTTLDGPELLRTAMTLPVFVREDPASPSGQGYTGRMAPGLNAQWAMDRILRANGYYTSPPVRAQCAVSATLHGSAYPEVGGIYAAHTYLGTGLGVQGPTRFSPHPSGLLGMGAESSIYGAGGENSWAMYSPVRSLSCNQGRVIFIEVADLDIGVATSTDSTFYFTNKPAGAGVPYIYVSLNIGSVYVLMNRGGSVADVTIPTAALTVGHHYLALHITFTTAGCDIVVRVDGTTYTAAGALVLANPTGNLDYNLVQVMVDQTLGNVDLPARVSGVQVTDEAYSTAMWNNTFTPTAVLQPSLNELTAMPAVEERMPWSLLQEIADAEQGVILFDESGVARFYNRNHMTGGATAVGAMRAVKELKGVSTSETIDSVRNIVRVPAAPLKIDTADAIIWVTSETLTVPAYGTLIVPAQFDGPAVSLDTTFVYIPAGAVTVASGSGYRAAQNSDGTGGDVSNLNISLAQYPARLVMFISNPNAFDVWIVNNSLAAAGEAGRPLLQIVGRLARPPENPYTSRAIDAGSVATYGQQSLDVPENQWRQSAAVAESLSAALLVMLKEPHAVLNGVEVVGDPRRQLADRVSLIDTNGIGWARDVWLLGITSRLDAGGFTQSVAVREAGSATSGMTGTFTWDVSYWDSLDGWAA